MLSGYTLTESVTGICRHVLISIEQMQWYILRLTVASARSDHNMSRAQMLHSTFRFTSFLSSSAPSNANKHYCYRSKASEISAE
jgi:hypothetical protein